jgi:hypothetical protein
MGVEFETYHLSLITFPFSKFIAISQKIIVQILLKLL